MPMGLGMATAASGGETRCGRLRKLKKYARFAMQLGRARGRRLADASELLFARHYYWPGKSHVRSYARASALSRAFSLRRPGVRDREDGRVSFGFSLMRGKRPNMEDFHHAQVSRCRRPCLSTGGVCVCACVGWGGACAMAARHAVEDLCGRAPCRVTWHFPQNTFPHHCSTNGTPGQAKWWGSSAFLTVRGVKPG